MTSPTFSAALPRSVRALVQPGGRATNAAILAVAVVCVSGLMVVLGLLATGARGPAPAPALPPGVVAVAPEARVAAGEGDTLDSLEIIGQPGLSTRAVAAAGRVLGADAVQDHRSPGVASVGAASAPTTLGTWDAARLAGVGLTTGTAPSAGEVVLARGTARAQGWSVGVTVRLSVEQPDGTLRTRTAHISGISDDRGAAGADGVLTTAGDLTALAPAAPVARVWAPVDPARTRHVVDALRKAPALRTGPVPVAVVAPGGRLPQATDLDSSSAVGLAAILGSVTTVVCTVLLMGTATFAVARRGRELALLRLTGATPGQVRRRLLGEALGIGVVATVIGVPVGLVLTPLVLAGLRAAHLLPDTAQPTGAVWPALVAAVAGLALPVTSVLVGSRRLSRIRPAQALREVDTPARRPSALRRAAGSLAALAALVLGLTVGQVPPERAANLALALAFIVIAAVSLLGPDIARFVMPLIGRVLPFTGPSGYAAGRSLGREPFRAAALAQPVLVATALASVLLGTGALIDRSAGAQSLQGTATAYLASPAGVTAGYAEQVRGAPGIRAAVLVRPTELVVRRPGEAGLIAYKASVVDHDLRGTQRLTTVSGNPAAVRTGQALVSAGVAGDNGWKVGSAITAYTPTGLAVRTTVGAVVESAGSYGDVVIGRAAVPLSAEGSRPAYLAVDGPAAAVAAASAQASRAAAVPWTVQTYPPSEWASGSSGRAERDVNGIRVIVAVVLGLGVIGLLVTGGVDLATRRHELDVVRASGATGGQVRRMLGTEGAVSALVGGVLGSLVTAVCLGLLARSLPGTPTPDLLGLVLPATVAVVSGSVAFVLLSVPLSRGNARSLVVDA